MNSALASRVKQAADHYGYSGPLEPGMVKLIEEEGFSAEEYKDDVGVSTQGVGQTGENAGKNFFTETYPKYVKRAQSKVKTFAQHPEGVQSAIISAVYRGDLGPKTVKLLDNKEYEAAAEEYLNHDEYKKRKKKNPKDGVVKRMEANAALIAEGGSNEHKPIAPPLAGESIPR